jgi:outer membrane protein TolC
MSKTDKTKIKDQKSKLWNSLILYVALCILIPSGCDQVTGQNDLYEVQVAPEKLRQIEALDLPQAKAEQDHGEVNEPPPEKIELTLEQCRAWALKNNLDLSVQLLSPTIAAERVTEQGAKFEPSAFANMSHNKIDAPTVSFLDTISGTQVDYFRTDLGVRMPLRSGGTVSFDAADSRTKTDAQLTTFNPYYDTDLSFSISQPLLRNAGQRANTHSIRIAQHERQIVNARTKLEVIRVVAALDRVYWRLYAARKELEVRERQHALAQAQLQQAQRFVDSGQMPPVEVVRAEAGVAQQLEAIIIAENNLRDRERELKQFMHQTGLHMRSATALIPVTEPDPVRYQLQPQRLVQTAMENRMEMLEVELQIAQDASTVEYMRNQALPLVTLDYAYNINGLDAANDDAFNRLFDKDFEDHRLGLQLIVPIGNTAADSRLRQAFYRRQQRLATWNSRRSLIELEVLNAIDQVEANWQRILASRQRAILDGRLYKAEKRQFELGLRTSTDVLEAQTSLAGAQSAEIQALAEYQIALVDLAYATGKLLGAAKVQWKPIVPVRHK